jgi:hypothetical protein
MLAIQLGQRTADGQPRQLLQQQATFPPPGQPQLADQLLVSGFASGRAGNPRYQFTIGHTFRVGYWKVEMQQTLQTGHQSIEQSLRARSVTKVLSLWATVAH